MDDFFINPILDLFSSSSKEPSNTIKISPIVPNIGKVDVKSGKLMLNSVVASLTTQPNTRSRITEGILVIDAVRSNK